MPAILVGMGLAAALDEIVFHQLLHWHHLYNRSTAATGLVSDGLLHLFATGLLVTGLVMLWADGTDVSGGRGRRLAGGIMVGAGGFNLFDGTVVHKALGWHQVREDVATLPYDAAFIGTAAVVFAAGLVLLGARRGGTRLPGNR